MQQDNTPQSNPTDQNQADIFISRPLPVEPPRKKSIWFTVGITLGVIFVFIAILISTLMVSASSQAHSYNGLALAQLKKTQAPLKSLEPQEVLNNHDIVAEVDKISLSQQAQPSLKNILFVGGINSSYVRAQKNQAKVAGFYTSIDQYTDDLSQLLQFDDTMVAVIAQDAILEPQLNPNDSLSIRSASGTYKDIAEKVSRLAIPSQLKDTQKSLVKSYKKRATIYENWAKSIEAGDKSVAATSQQAIQAEKDKVAKLVSDKNFAKLFTPDYKNLTSTQKSLLSTLANS